MDLTAPSRVSLTETLDMAHIVHAHLQVVLDTLMGRNHPSSHVMETFLKALKERETEMEEYSLWDKVMRPKLPALLTRCIQIRLSDWIARKW